MMAIHRLSRQPSRYTPTRDLLGLRPDFEPFFAPNTLHLLTADDPSLFGQQSAETTVAIAGVRPRQGYNTLVELVPTIRHRLGGIPIGRTGQVQGTACPSHRAQSLANYMIDGRFFLRRAYHFFEFTSLSTRFSSMASASIFFNSAFSFSKTLSRLASANSISPYFFFQR